MLLSRRTLELSLCVLANLSLVSSASAATLFVAQRGAPNPAAAGSCLRPNFALIQAAIDAASAGDVIVVCPGTYVEQPVVSSQSLRLLGRPGAIIQAPAAGSGAVVLFEGPQSSEIKGFTVSGAGAPAILTGIRADGFDFDGNPPPNSTTTLAVIANHVLDIAGRGIFIEEADGQVLKNLVEHYATEGIRVDGNQLANTSASVRANLVRGGGPSGTAPSQVGIALDECTVTVALNKIFDNVGADAAQVSAGVVVEFADATLTGNVVLDNRVGIRLEPGFESELRFNLVRDSVQNGVELLGTSDAVLFANSIQDNGGDGILVDERNLMAVDNLIDSNNVSDNGGAGTHLTAGTADNTVRNNLVEDNGGFDLLDETGDPPANTYANNQCDVSSPPGLCI